MAGESKEGRWEGKEVVEIGGSSAEAAWAAIEDFCNLDKWFPIDTCYPVEGGAGEPGLTRYCALTVRDAESHTETLMWAKEKLLTIDPLQRSLSYQIVDSNMGFKYYVATLTVLPLPNAACKIQWEFVCDPIEVWTLAQLQSYIQSCLAFMADKLQLSTSSSA